MDPVLPVQADEQPMAGSGMEGTPVDPILESPGARQHVGEPIAAVGGLGGGEQLSSTMDEPVTAPSATAGAAESFGVEAVVTNVAPESAVENLAMSKEQTALPRH